MKRPVLMARATPALVSAKVWVQERSQREQVLILGFGVLLAVTLFWLAIVAPLLGARAEAKSRIAAYETIKARIAGAGPASANRNAMPSGPIEGAIAAQAATFGLTPGPMTRQDGDLVVTVTDARFDSVTPWLAALEASGGVTIQSVKMIRRPGEGIVNVELKVRET